MSEPVKRRRYDTVRRAAGAEQTRIAILAAAKDAFERHGWAGTTMPRVAAGAGVSPKTVEAVFGTKAALLQAVVDYAIRGDTGEVPIAQRDAAQAIVSAPNAARMLDLHAAMAATINERSAWIAGVVESAAPADERVAELWQRMSSNFRAGVHWAATTAAAKPGLRVGLTATELEQTFLVGMTWSTYRALNLSQDGFEAWLRSYYGRMLLARPQPRKPPGRSTSENLSLVKRRSD